MTQTETTGWNIEPPDGQRETRRYHDFFQRRGVTKATILESVSLTQQRTSSYFGALYEYFDETGGFKAACGMGCAYCCHTAVSVVAPEAFYLAKHIETAFKPEESRALIERIVEHDRQHRGKSGAQRHVGRIACPMLDPETWLCRVHEARPLTCRSMHSSDVKPCRVGFEEGDAYHSIPSHRYFFANTQAYYDAFGNALRHEGLHVEPIELNASLAIIWTEKRVFQRWLKGENPFEAANAEYMMTDAPPPNA